MKFKIKKLKCVSLLKKKEMLQIKNMHVVSKQFYNDAAIIIFINVNE